ncbi:MAG: Na+/H+ antiporter subunit C [Thiohalorhabdus sp.]|uniref:Na+/H+ antiporter subunit C n=1 Tax=Thiohalorhabdus sp. TaxID=3094134 RepID=UPI003980EEE7
MALVVALTVGWLTACGVYLVLRARTFSVILGITLLSHAANLTLFFSGGLPLEVAPPLVGGEAEAHADPLPQALVLTAIVISFAMTAFVLILALRNRRALKSDHVDGRREGA